MEKYYLYLAGYTEMIQPPLDFFDFCILLLQPFNLRIFSKPLPSPPAFFCTIIIHPSQCENHRMWETGENERLEREPHRIMYLEGYLNKEKVRLSRFTSKERVLWELYADSLSRSVIAQLSLFLAWLLWGGCSSGPAVPDQNLCRWPQRGPFWRTTISLAFSNCPASTGSLLLSLAAACPCPSLPRPTLQTELHWLLHTHLQSGTTVPTHSPVFLPH